MPEFLEALKNYAWKGNIRELRNVLERAVILADGDMRPELLPFDGLKLSESKKTFRKV